MNEEQDPFEEMNTIQYWELYSEEDTPLDSIRSDTFRWLIYAGALLTAAFIISGFVFKINRYEHVEFVLRSEVPDITYQFYDDLYLQRYSATTGDTVEHGAPLAVVQSEEIRKLVTNLSTADTDLQNLEKDRKHAHESEIRTLRLKNEKLSLQQENLRINRTITDSLFQLRFEELQSDNMLAANDLNRAKTLFEKELISEQAFENVRQIAFRTSNRLEQLKSTNRINTADIEGNINQLGKQIAVNKSNMKALTDKFEADRQLLVNRRKDILTQLENNYGSTIIQNGSLILTASQQGMISYHLETDKLIPAGSVLMKLESPEESSFYSYATINSELAGRIYSNLPAIIKINAYPHYDWGTIDGLVYLVSRTSNELGQYGLKIIFNNEQAFRGTLKKGMTGTASIPLESKSLFGYLFDEVEEVYSEIYNK